MITLILKIVITSTAFIAVLNRVSRQQYVERIERYLLIWFIAFICVHLGGLICVDRGYKNLLFVFIIFSGFCFCDVVNTALAVHIAADETDENLNTQFFRQNMCGCEAKDVKKSDSIDE